jgi:3-oxoacyl-[acyl-carrier protein] reductase
MNLQDRVALVTGGSGGIGYAIAHALGNAGARVAITGRNEEKLARAAESLNAHAIRADVSREEDVLRTWEEALDRFGHVDVLVNNAGVGYFVPLLETDRERFEQVFRTNVTGAMLMAREAARHFISRNGGNIVNIASTAALRGAPRGTTYYASKFALRGMTECWRSELRAHNVRVFLINPSEVITGLAGTLGMDQPDDPTKLHPEDIAHIVRAVLEMDDRGFTTELTVFATNPSK